MTNGDQAQRVVLITGGASGLGRTIAEAFLHDGAIVHICDADAENIDAFRAANATASATLCDVGDAAQVDAVFEDLMARYDRLDILVNNAGMAGPTASAEDISVTEWDRCMAVNVSGVFYFTRLAIPLLRQQEGSAIVNIASTAGLMGCPNRSPYVASKWGMVGLTKTWAMELGPDNIRVNAICPTCIDGDRIERVIENDAEKRGVSGDEIRDVYKRQTSMRTFVSGQDVANMVMFLGSEGAAKVSGQIIAVDGHTETLTNWLD